MRIETTGARAYSRIDVRQIFALTNSYLELFKFLCGWAWKERTSLSTRHKLGFSNEYVCVWSFRFVFHFLWTLRSTSRKWKDIQPQHVLGWRHENLPFTLFSLVINCYNFENTKEVWCKIWEALLTSFPQVLNLSRCLSHYANFDIQQTNGRVAMNERIRSFAFDR